MDKLINIVMKTLNLLSMIIGIAVNFVPSLSLNAKIIITLICFLVYSLCNYVSLYQRHKDLSNKFEQVNHNHKALVRLFTVRQKTIKEYENAVHSSELLLALALLNTKEQKIKNLADSIMFHFKNIK